MSSTAAFSITASASTDIGYDATNSEVLTLTLEASPALDVHSVAWSISQKSNGANVLTFSDAAPQPPTTPVTLTMPATGWHSWVIRCVVNGGVDALGNIDPALTSERLVAILSGAGLRKIVPAERTQYNATDGWSAAFNDAIGGGASGMGADALVGARFSVSAGTVESQLQDIIDQLAFAGAHAFSGISTLQAGLTLSTVSPFPIDATGVATSKWEVQANGLMQFVEETSGTELLGISPGASGGSDLLRVGLTRMEFSALTSQRFIYIKGLSGTGGANGASLSFQGQPGQAQGGGAQTNGGDFIMYMGAIGAGGTGSGRLGRLVESHAGAENYRTATTRTNFSTLQSDVITHEMVDDDVIMVTAKLVARSATAATARARGIISTQTFYRLNGGGVTTVGAPTVSYNQGNTAGATAINFGASGTALSVSISPGELMDATLFVELKVIA